MSYQNIYTRCHKCNRKFRFELQLDTPNGDVLDYYAGENNVIECHECGTKHKIVEVNLDIEIKCEEA